MSYGGFGLLNVSKVSHVRVGKQIAFGATTVEFMIHGKADI